VRKGLSPGNRAEKRVSRAAEHANGRAVDSNGPAVDANGGEGSGCDRVENRVGFSPARPETLKRNAGRIAAALVFSRAALKEEKTGLNFCGVGLFFLRPALGRQE